MCVSAATPRKPSIRQVYADRTKSAILEAARHVFAKSGYSEAGIRDIAALAKVNPALAGRYFGSKLELFEAALNASFDVTYFTNADRRSFGADIAHALCASENDAAFAVPMLLFAAGDSAARGSALRILMERVVAPLTVWFGQPEAAERAAQLLAVVTGFYSYRIMLPLSTVAGQPSQAMQRWLATTLQEIVDR